jgi:hypothetical protein
LTNTIYAALLDAISEEGGAVDEHALEGWVASEGFGDNGSWLAVGQAYEDHEAAAVYAVYAPPVADDLRNNMALLLTHLNSGLVLGNFELDLSDGEVRFKASAHLGRVPDPEAIRTLLDVARSVADHYLPAIAAVASGRDVARVVAELDAE